MGYTKLFSTIVTSTIWRESVETKVVWVTMLALSNKHGIVEASIPGLAAMSGVSIEACESALAVLESPDRYSRTPDNQGRRVEAIPGGWELLNHKLYRERLSDDERREYERLRKQRQRAREKGNVPNCPGQVPDPSRNVGDPSQMSRKAEEEEEDPEAGTKNPPTPPAGGSAGKPRRVGFSIDRRLLPFQSPPFLEAWDRWERNRRETGKPIREQAFRQQCAKMREWGEATAIAALLHSTAGSYQGLYAPNQNGKPPTNRNTGTANEHRNGPRTLREIQEARSRHSTPIHDPRRLQG